MSESATGVRPRMSASRIEAFSDGVIAIIITIMVLELHPPEDASFASLRPLVTVFLAYALSFVFVAVYWNNHHHLLKACDGIDGRVMWANMHLLFWLSLVPFTTAWVGHRHDDVWPAAIYGIVALMCGVAYTILLLAILRANPESEIAQAIGADGKGKLSIAIYAAAVLLAFVHPWISYALYFVVLLIWFIPDRRLSR